MPSLQSIQSEIRNQLPISNLVEAIKFAEIEIKNYGLRAPMVGHVGDGNFHVAIQYDPSDKDSYKVIREFSDKLIHKALELEGTKLISSNRSTNCI